MNIAGLLDVATGYKTYVMGAAIVLLAGALGVQTLRLSEEKADHARDQAADEKARAMQVAAVLVESERQRRKYEDRIANLTGIVDDTIRIAQGVAADAVAARGASDRMREYAASLVAAARKARGNPAPAVGGAPAADPVDLLAELHRRADARAGELAAIADARGTAGRACERAYDTLGK